MSSYYDADQEGESGTLLSERTQKARKEHICQDCGKVIQIGERYNVIVGLYDGDFFYVKSHTGRGYCAMYEERHD